jgi:hypothetical protein
VDVSVEKLSSCKPREFVSSSNTLKKYKRYYDDGLSLNFYNAFTKIRDIKHKNYSTFYLTDEMLLDNIKEPIQDDIKADALLTKLNFGSNYLKFNLKDRRTLATLGIFNEYLEYGDYSFQTDITSSSEFIIEFMGENRCNVYATLNYKRYYLGMDNTGILSFYAKGANVAPILFNYVYSKTNNSLCLFENSNGVCKILTKLDSNLFLQTFDEDNKILAINNAILIDRPLYNSITNNDNFSLVGYDITNKIPNNLITKDLKNNYLIHVENNNPEIITLKNQLTQSDLFTSGNNLLSSNMSIFFMEGMRDYTSIFNDIDNEKDETIALNYVMYNKPYTIKSGINYVKAPTSIFPYIRLNVNDSKFVECGAFSFDTPIYADRIYRLDNDNGYDDGQVYLCTWLSGSPLSDSKVWVDRYYYPDMIEKEEALKFRSSFNPTYQELVEIYVNNNTSTSNSLSAFQIFDKKSDFVIEANDEFIYERIGNLNTLSETLLSDTMVDKCDVNNLNYFEDINNEGEFTLFIVFEGDDNNWVFSSNRNNINAGLSMVKTNDVVNFVYTLFDPSSDTFVNYTTSQTIKKLKKNFLAFSINAKKGIGYVNLNGNVVLSMTFDAFQFLDKKLLFGNFNTNAKDLIFDVYTKALTINESLILPFTNGLVVIDDITITLPCDQRNSEDDIDLLQTVCNNQAFKSNYINVLIKNAELPENIQSDLNQIIADVCDRYSPLTTEINNIIYFK